MLTTACSRDCVRLLFVVFICLFFVSLFFFFFNDTATTEIYTLSLHDGSSDLSRRTAWLRPRSRQSPSPSASATRYWRSEEHTSELQSLRHLVCRLLLEKKKKTKIHTTEP